MKFTNWDFKVPVAVACRVEVIAFRGFGLMSGVTACGRTTITVRKATVILRFGGEVLRTGSKGPGGGTV